MAQAQVIQRATPSRVIQGTPEEIATHLKTLKQDEMLTLIIPGQEIQTTEKPASTGTEPPHAGMTFAEILEPLQQDFEETGMTDEELGEFIDAEIEAYRAERRAKARPSNG